MFRRSDLFRAAAVAMHLCWVGAAFADGGSVRPPHVQLPPELDLSAVAQPNETPHQGIPAGVPGGYDWRLASRMLDPAPLPGFNAVTGWGQAFWRDGTGTPDQALEMKDSQTLLCTESGGQYTWARVQSGAIEGAAFTPDFASNANIAAAITTVEPGYIRVIFPTDRAFHYWPLGRAPMSSPSTVCGVLYVFQARVVRQDGTEMPTNSEAPALIIGGGADYWTNVSSPWVGTPPYNNQGIGVGQLRTLSVKWHWFGFSTASWAALHVLDVEGYTVAP